MKPNASILRTLVALVVAFVALAFLAPTLGSVIAAALFATGAVQEYGRNQARKASAALVAALRAQAHERELKAKAEQEAAEAQRGTWVGSGYL